MSTLADTAHWTRDLGDYVNALAVAPDGRLLLAGALNGRAQLIDTRTGDVVDELVDHPFGVLCAAWSRDGSLLAVGGHDKMLRLYRQNGADVVEVGAVELGGWVASVAWSPVADLLAAAAGRQVTMVDADAVPCSQYSPVTSTITDLVWATNGHRVGAAAYGAISWYDVDALDKPEPSRTHRWKGSLLALAMSPDGKWVCAGAQDSSIHLWKLWSGNELSMSGYPAKIENIAFRDDGAWMASACLAELTVWDFRKRGPNGTAPASGENHTRHIEALAWQPDGDILATGGADGRLCLWPSPVRSGDTLRPRQVLDSDVGIASLAWLPGGEQLVTARADGHIEARTIVT